MTEAILGPEAVSHSAEAERPHAMDADCWCEPRRERFVYDDKVGASGHWEIFDRETKKWRPKTDGEG